MQDLHLIGVHEDGEHLLLGDGTGSEFRLRLDDALRRAARHESKPAPEASGQASTAHGPREVQAMIRAGASSEEAAERAGWSLDKVHRFDGPILAERGHIAAQAAQTRLRGRYGEAGATLAERVLDRLHARGVAAQSLTWDAWRTEDGQWTVVARFSAGGRAREATWSYLRQSGTVHALDDEALWLAAEDEPESPIPRRHGRPEHGRADDGRAEHSREDRGSGGAHEAAPAVAPPRAPQPAGGGDIAARPERAHQPTSPSPAGQATSSSQAARVSQAGRAGQSAPAVARRRVGSPAMPAEPEGAHPDADLDDASRGDDDRQGHAAPFEVEAHEDRFDLMDSVRQRSSAGRRRGGVVRRAHRVEATPGAPASPAALPPAAGVTGDAALPLADLGYDPETMEPPPGAHSDPQPDGPDGRPEPPAAVAAQRPKPNRTRRTTKVAPPRNRPAGKAEAEPAMPARTKRRRPAAFPGALENDPGAEGAADGGADEAVGEGAVAGTAVVAAVVAEDAVAATVAPDDAAVKAHDALDDADGPDDAAATTRPGDLSDDSEATDDAALSADEPVDVTQPQVVTESEDVTELDEADQEEDARIAAGAAEGPTASDGAVSEDAAGEDPDEQSRPVVGGARPSVASDTVNEPQLPLDDDAAEAKPEPAAAEDDDAAEQESRTTEDEPSAAPAADTAPRETAAKPAIPKPGPPPGNRKGRPKGRASVPSWDDIMFGSRRE